MKHVESLVSELDGKIVITSDHGEYLGENGRLGHPKYSYSEAVRKVPWLIIDAETQPEITDAQSAKRTDVAGEDIEEHLKHLGYRE